MSPVDVAGELIAAVRMLARHRLGAVILWNPAVVVEGGVVLDAFVSSKLLVSLAIPESVNELIGAVVIRGNRIERAGVPVSWATVVECAADLATGGAVAVDEDDGKIRIADPTGRVHVVEANELVGMLRLHAG